VSRVFLDTNIIIYANDRRDPKKQAKARQIVVDLMQSGDGVISTQVLQEYASVAILKLAQQEDVVLRQLKLLETFETVGQTPLMIRRAVELKKLYGVHFWDACIIANAEAADCSTIYSEDMNTGQFYFGIQVINPLAAAR